MKQSKSYRQPETTVTRVELESSVCGGSVQFGDEKNRIDINSQEVASGNGIGDNDFSGQEWTVQ